MLALFVLVLCNFCIENAHDISKVDELVSVLLLHRERTIFKGLEIQRKITIIVNTFFRYFLHRNKCLESILDITLHRHNVNCHLSNKLTSYNYSATLIGNTRILLYLFIAQLISLCRKLALTAPQVITPTH